MSDFSIDRNWCNKCSLKFVLFLHILSNPENSCVPYSTKKRQHSFSIPQSFPARSSFHLSVLESVYIKTQNPVLCMYIKTVHFLICTLQVNNDE